MKYPTIKGPTKLKRYKTPRALMASMLEVSYSEVVDFKMEAGYPSSPNEKPYVMDMEKVFQSIEDHGIWGFVDKKRVIHYWCRKDISFDIMFEFLAHEIGHMNGRQYKNTDKEEIKASETAFMAMRALRLTRQVLKRKG